METEHQEHFGGPSAESLDRGQPRDHVFIWQRVELVETQPAVGDPRG